MINRHATFNAGHYQVLDAHVCKRSANHHFVITAPCAVAVEVFDVDAALLEV
jgi:hypothetical protein